MLDLFIKNLNILAMETIIQKALRTLLDKFGADYLCVTVSEDGGHYRATIETDNASRLIGRSGQTLNALQILLKNGYWRTKGKLDYRFNIHSLTENNSEIG